MEESSNPYSQLYASQGAAVKYNKKFSEKVHLVRHLVEVAILKQHVHGELFDASVGEGRFIQALSEYYTRYTASDYSPDFLQFINQTHPTILTERNDLEKHINQPDQTFDTVVCLRTLFALKQVRTALLEMLRILKKDGVLIVDYGTTKGFDTSIGIPLNTESIELLLAEVGGIITKKYRVDGLVSFFMRQHFCRKVFNSRYNMLPLSFWVFVEQLTGSFFGTRVVYIVHHS